MATLSDLLVSYKQVEAPTYTSTPELPMDRFARLQQYIDNRNFNETSTKETSEETSTSTFRWYYNPDTKSRTETMNSSTTSNLNNTPIIPKNDWVKQLSQAYRSIGVSENGIRNLIAKNALESNWGKSAQGRYNYGNITTGSSWKGDYVNGHDTDGQGRAIRNKFRSYNSLKEFAQDEVNFLKRLYDFNDNDDIDTFTYKLQGGNKGKRYYAENPKYRNSIKNIYKSLR